jgi:amino acid adenylation domain-containing protein
MVTIQNPKSVGKAMNDLGAEPNNGMVSVIIPAYNSARFLPEAIESALNQTQTVSEIVVIDDGSIDDTQAVCDRYPQVKYIYQSNQGSAGARNTGIGNSQGEYLIFLDADDCLLSDAVEIGMCCLAAHPDAGLVFGRHLFRSINPDGSYSTQKLFDEPPALASYATILASEHNIQCATAICRRGAVESVGGFGTNLANVVEDINFFLRMARKFPIYFHDRVVSEYRCHGGNQSSNSAKMLTRAFDTHSLEWEYVRDKPELLVAYERGKAAWIKFYGDRILYDAIRLVQVGEFQEADRQLQLVLSYDPTLSWIDTEAYAVATSLLTSASQDRLDVSTVEEGYPQGSSQDGLDVSTVEAGYPQGAPLQIAIDSELPVDVLPISPSSPLQRCIHQLFAECVDAEPDRVALLFKTQQITYGELNDRANRLAHYLINLGVKVDDIVGIAIDRSVETIVGILGILKAGGAYLPLDLASPSSRISAIVTDAQVSIILTQADLVHRLPQQQARIICLDNDWSEIAEAESSNPQVAVQSENLAYVMYTSGSTGTPKGVCIPHRGVVRLVKSTNYLNFSPDLVFLHLAPIAFDASTFEIWGSLLNGAKLVICPTEKPSLAELGQIIDRHQVTTLWLTAGLFQAMVDERIEDLQPLRHLIAGGDVLSVPHVRKVLSTLEHCQLINGYGPTENTTFTCCYQISKTDTFATGVPIGKPISNTQVYILDADLRSVPIGSEGELYTGGDGLARGYLNRPDLTAERFMPNPFAESGRLYKTGDLARYLPSGDIEYLGRIDAQVKIRGFRIELGEIETVLGRHPEVREVRVIARAASSAEKQLVAYMVSTNPRSMDVGKLREYLQQQLPDYMVPSAFVCMDAMPLTRNGKIDLEALPAPTNSSLGVSANIIAPSNSTERVLTAIWTEILRLERVGIEDNFFDLGGNSLLGLRVIDRIRSQFDLDISVVRLYQYSTIRSMSRYLEGESTSAAISIADNKPPVKNNAVAVIGMVGRFPGANSVEELWSNLCAGKESITFFAEDEIDASIDRSIVSDPNYVRAKGVLTGAELFDAAFFGIGAREAEIMDPQTRVFLELSYEALENAGYTAGDDNRIGMYAGSAENTYFDRHISGRADLLDRFGEFHAHLVNDRDYLTTRVSYKLNLKGPSINVSTACSTSLVAIIQAYQGLLSHQCDLALAGGVAINTPQEQGYLHQEGSIFSPDGHCRPFDVAAAGTSFNNGAGIVVLKRLEEAIADGDRIYTIIKGVGINNDGADKVSFTAPSVSGQMGAILQAQQMAGVEPDGIAYIEAHGTGTALGDPIEIEALTQAFRTQTTAKQFCGIGSIKSNLGHLTGAAGVAGFIKTVLALYHRQIPPSINFDRPNPHIDFANSPFYVNDKLVEWKSTNMPRRAGVSSFGGGGTNAHAILEEPPHILSSNSDRSYQLLLLSGKTETAIDNITTNLRTYLEQTPDPNLADVAYTLQQGRKIFDHRRFIVCHDRESAIAHLTTLPPQLTATRHTNSQNPTVVFMFSGQGSQYVNMGLDLYRSEPVFQQAIDTCAEILQPILERDIRELIYPQTEDLTASSELLNQTQSTQPALFAIEYALAQLWQSWGIKPIATIGHSVGEFVCACLAGVFSLADALKLVAARGKLVGDLPCGSMLSVRLAGVEMERRLTSELAIAAYNSTSLCVVSGLTPAIELLQQELEGEEIACRLLHTSHAFHSPMMEPVVVPFTHIVRDIKLNPPQIPFVSSVTGEWITTAQATNPEYWGEHLLKPVRFADGIQTICQHDPNIILLEVGPRQTLATLARQSAIANSWQNVTAIASIESRSGDNGEWQFLLQSIGQLWLAGVSVDWGQFYHSERRHRVPLPTYPFERQQFWIPPLMRGGEGTRETLAADRPEPSLANSVTIHPIQIVSSERISATSEFRALRLMPLIIDVLKDIAGTEISVADDRVTFLELGLDSLSLTQVALALKKKFKVKITFRQLLEDCSTLATLAESIDLQLPSDAFAAPVIDPVLDLVVSTDLAPQTADIAPQQAKSTGAIDTSNPPTSKAHSPLTIESVIQQQLQIMAQQLELLGGRPSIPEPIESLAQPVAESVERVPTPPVSNNGHGNSNGKISNIILPTEPTKLPPQTPAPGLKINKSVDNNLTPKQQQALANIIDRYVARTQESKRQAQAHRAYLADPRTVSGFSPLLKEVIYPIVTDRAKGSKLWDEDGNEYIDLTNGFGLNFFGWSPDFVIEAIKAQLDKGMAIGPQTPLAGKVAKKIAQFTGMERVAFCNTGSEAVMAALRIARTVTGRDRVVLFSGSYHGTFDEVLVRAGAAGKSYPSAPGVMASAVENILVLDYDAPGSLEIIRQNADDIAAILVEPVQSRHPHLQPQEFLQALRKITIELGIALIIDEVITGFRVAPGGAQEYFGIKGDIATYGKVVGGGMPIGILTGSTKYMDALDGGFWQFGDRSIPEVGVTFFAGTFVRHPLALAAVDAILTKLEAGGSELQIAVTSKTEKVVNLLVEHVRLVGAPIEIEHFSSWFYITFPPNVPYGSLLFYLLRERGIHVWENRPCFLTLAHSDEDIDKIIWAVKMCIAELQSVGFLSSSANAIVINNNLPPQPGARLGKDRDGNAAWFIVDPDRVGKYLQITTHE